MKRSCRIPILFFLVLFTFGISTHTFANKKYITEVHVYTKSGNPCQSCKVSLEFGTWGGFSSRHYTNSDGIAYVKHASKGTVKVYVDGNWSSHKTKGKAPGRIVVYLTR